MTDTLFELTRATAETIGQGVYIEGVATGGSTTSIVDGNDRDEADDYWNKGTAWIIYDAGGAAAAPQGEYSIISDFTSSSGTITLRSTLTTAVASGDRYALCKKRFKLNEMLIPMVNRALYELGPMPFVDTSSISTESSKTEYNLPAAVSDLRRVYVQGYTDDSDDNRWEEVYGWDVEVTATGTADKLIFPYQLASGLYVKLEYVGRHPRLVNASDKMAEGIDIRRVVNFAAAAAIRAYMDKTDDNTYEAAYVHLMGAAEEYKLKNPLRLPRRAVKTVVYQRSGLDWSGSTPYNRKDEGR